MFCSDDAVAYILIHMLNVFINQCNQLFAHLSILFGKTFNVAHFTQTFEPNVFISAILIGIIDIYYFLPLSLTLTLDGVTRSTQSETCWLYFLA